LELLAELVVGALKPEDEDRFAESAQVAEAKLATPIPVAVTSPVAAALSPIIAAVAEPVLAQVETTPKTPAVASVGRAPASQSDVPQSTAEPKLVAEETSAVEVAHKPERITGHHPGIVLVLLLIVVSTVLAGALWWKLKNAQLAEVMVRPEP